MKKIKLFCLPYGGGSAVSYLKWEKYLDPAIELRPVELTGRGLRLHSPLYKDIDEALEDILSQILKETSETTPYAIFGHSFGALLTFETAHLIKKRGMQNQPCHLFFSGLMAPHLTDTGKIVHNLPEKQFCEEVLKLNSAVKEVFENEEMKKIFMPIIRNDYRLFELYQFREKPHKLGCDASILYSDEDEFLKGKVSKWREYFEKECRFYEYSGGHFFINRWTEEVVCLINRILLEKP